MKKCCLLSLALFCVSSISFSQHAADKWYFGNNAGIDFSTGSPTAVLNSQMAAGEGSASISDPVTGDLLFYTDGRTVWNVNNAVMPNGTGLMGGMSSTQAALIVPKPDNANEYYIFTTDQTGDSLGLRFSIVNMLLDGGNGDLNTRNIRLKAPVTEKVTAVRQPETSNYWLVTHGWNDDAFYAFKVTPSGIDSAVVSHTGIVHSNALVQNSYGQMKFNTCGDKLALAAGYLDKVEIFDFDVATGVVSNPQTISYNDHVYGVEFSPDNNLLYVSTYQITGTLLQYDLSLNTPDMIAQVKTISTTPDIYPLQRGPDGKIYVVKSYSQYLGVIQSPNSIGAVACNYIENGFDLDPAFMGYNSGIGLPNFVSSFIGDDTNCPLGSSGISENLLVAGSVSPNPSNSNFIFNTKASCSEIRITDASGKLLETHKDINAGKTFTFGEAYVPGVYFLNAFDFSGKSAVLRIVKTN